MSIFEYDEELHMKQVKEEGRQEGVTLGRQEGLTLGRQEGLTLGRQEGLTLGRQEGLTLGRQEGRQEGETKSKIKLIKKKLNKGLEISIICEHLEESIDFVEKVCKLMKENPSADVNAIWKML